MTLPDTVKTIPSDIFNECSSLREMNFPSSLEVIEYDAFWGTGFTEIVLPDSVVSIWNYAFKNCVNLRSIDLGNVVSLGDGVFMGCSELTSIVFPDTIRDLSGNYMFDGCSKLTQITFPSIPVAVEYSFLDGSGYYNDASNWENGVLYLNRHLITVNDDFVSKTEYTVKEGTICIANHAFVGAGISLKVKKITLPEGLLSIGAGAFNKCSLLTETNIPSSVRYVGKDAYYETALYQVGKTNYLDHWLLSYAPQSNQTKFVVEEGTVGIAEGKLFSSGAFSITEVVLPDSLKVIGECNFESMSAVTSIKLSKSLERIGKDAFRYCYALSDLDLSVCTSLKTIEDYAFSFCKAMTRFYIPASVQELGEGVFNQIPNVVVDFEIEESEIPAGWSKSWDFTYADVPVIANWGVKNDSSF
ncbi:MAG TPA: leucine-rich repeat domain-containing protein [Firmicutes bacterium]|nr:leucine-rich repeat domain-containing protein [Bacillota bacterium]